MFELGIGAEPRLEVLDPPLRRLHEVGICLAVRVPHGLEGEEPCVVHRRRPVIRVTRREHARQLGELRVVVDPVLAGVRIGDRSRIVHDLIGQFGSERCDQVERCGIAAVERAGTDGRVPQLVVDVGVDDKPDAHDPDRRALGIDSDRAQREQRPSRREGRRLVHEHRIVTPPGSLGIEYRGQLDRRVVVRHPNEETRRLVEKGPCVEQLRVCDQHPGRQCGELHGRAVADAEVLVAEQRHRPEVPFQLAVAGVVPPRFEQAEVDQTVGRRRWIAGAETGDRRPLELGRLEAQVDFLLGERSDGADVELCQRGRRLVELRDPVGRAFQRRSGKLVTLDPSRIDQAKEHAVEDR